MATSSSLYFLMCGNDMVESGSNDRPVVEVNSTQEYGSVGIFEEDVDEPILSGKKKSYLQMIYCGLTGSDEGETYEEAMRRAYEIRLKKEKIARESNSFSIEADTEIDTEAVAWWTAIPQDDDTSKEEGLPTRDTEHSLSPLTADDKENIAAAKELLSFGFEENAPCVRAGDENQKVPQPSSPAAFDTKKIVQIIQVTTVSPPTTTENDVARGAHNDDKSILHDRQHSPQGTTEANKIPPDDHFEAEASAEVV
mmetsp:Transcript_4239/g.5978  ORF Transcript_4239/g.5978 Transcript_4239/m.5978 type:complete len:253 (-) Transcript_4239:130-888(-)